MQTTRNKHVNKKWWNHDLSTDTGVIWYFEPLKNRHLGFNIPYGIVTPGSNFCHCILNPIMVNWTPPIYVKRGGSIYHGWKSTPGSIYHGVQNIIWHRHQRVYYSFQIKAFTYFSLYFDDFINLDVVFCCISLWFVLFHVIFISHLTGTTINKKYIKTYIKSKSKYSVNN